MAKYNNFIKASQYTHNPNKMIIDINIDSVKENPNKVPSLRVEMQGLILLTMYKLYGVISGNNFCVF